jgi:hypothetical protein
MKTAFMNSRDLINKNWLKKYMKKIKYIINN